MSIIELACRSAECAPPPVGRGGSLPGEMDPVWGTPPEPGTAALAEGEHLAYHYTSSDEALSGILKEGVRLDKAKGETYGEPSMVWGSFERPQPGKPYVEFKVRREDMVVGQPYREEDMARMVQQGSNFTLVDGIPVDRITTWSNQRIEDARMWKDELSDADEAWKRKVLNGAYDGAPGVDKAKQVLAKEFGSPGWAEKPSGISDDVAVKVKSIPRVDTDRLQRRADRLRREINDPEFVYPGARMGFRHRAAELTAIESELVRRGGLAVEDRRTSVVAGLIELACRDASCAPPPVGTGGSSPAQGLVGDKLRTQVVETIEDVQAGSAEGLKFARQMMASREKTMGFHDLDPHNQALDAGFEAEWKALAKVVPVEEGFVRRGTPEAEALISEVRNVLPAAQVGQFQDVHADSVRALMDGVRLYPEEVRAKIEGVALGYTEAEQHVAAFGPHGGGLNGPYASQWTLWLGPKAVRPAVGEARPEGVAASVIATVSGTNRQRLVAAHEMGHVVHSMAGEIAWKESGFYVDTRTDPQVPDVPTTPYGETSKGERVAETFALAARDTFAGLEPSQQDLIVSVLDRAGLRPSDLAFAAATDEPYEVQFWGDSFELDEAAAELQASGCQSADCAPPPVGTGGSKGGESWPMREEDRESAAGVKVGLAYQRWIKEGDNIRLVRKAYALNERIYELATARSEYTPSLSQAEAYDQAVKDLDAHPAMYDDWYITTSWWASMRRVVSATSKSEHPDPDMTKLLSEMHRMTVEALGGPGSTIELGRSFDSGAADVGNSPDKFDWSRSSSDSASSGITSWTNNNNEYDSWGEESVVKTFPVEQVLMREGSIDGEFLVGESVERVQEIVGR